MTAYFLHQKGWSVTIVEKDRFGSGASHGNCGLIVPSHAAPLNSPDNLITGIGWMLRKDAPLFIKLQTDAFWIRWMLQFIRHCFGNHRHVAAAGRAALMTDALSLYDTIIQAEQIDCDWDMAGTCHLFRSKKELAIYDATSIHIRDLHSPMTFLKGNRLRNLIPGIATDVIGGWHDHQAAHFRPDTFMHELAGILRKKGIDIIEQTTFIGFDKQYGRAVSARTNQGVFPADAFVVATGAWTSLLSHALGCRIPIQPGKGYSVTARCTGDLPVLPCFFEETRVVLTPWGDRLRLGGTMEFSGFDDSLNPRRVAALFKATKQYMPVSIPDKIEEAWCGWRPITWDGVPIIDHLPDMDNVVLAAGHNELGLTMAPATGRLVAEMMTNETPSIDPSFYGIDRAPTAS
jgi:D-amino-acid dehydrogenase